MIYCSSEVIMLPQCCFLMDFLGAELQMWNKFWINAAFPQFSHRGNVQPLDVNLEFKKPKKIAGRAEFRFSLTCLLSTVFDTEYKSRRKKKLDSLALSPEIWAWTRLLRLSRFYPAGVLYAAHVFHLICNKLLFYPLFSPVCFASGSRGETYQGSLFKSLSCKNLPMKDFHLLCTRASSLR